MKKLSLILIIFVILILVLTVRGIHGNPSAEELNSPLWTNYGPFELSPERGRFALTYSVTENKSLSFSVPLAKFATPDLGYINGKYVSLFAPAVSFIVAPGYFLGKLMGSSQIGTFAVVALFALCNALLIKAIASCLKFHLAAAWLGAIMFAFATPAFTYAVNLYQHHISTFLILLSVYILLRSNSLPAFTLIWFLYAVSVLVDYPNLPLMLPIILYTLRRLIAPPTNNRKLTTPQMLKRLSVITAAVLPLLFFFWFNANSYGNPLQLSGTVPDVREIDSSGQPIFPKENRLENSQGVNTTTLPQKSIIGFFKIKNIFNGLNVLIISPDRGVLYFTPVILTGVLGVMVAYKWMPKLTKLLVTIIGINILLYSMWGDPWGGWAFGSRYLIPSYAILSIFVAFLLTLWRRKTLFLFIFFIIFSYSAAVNTLGAITSSSNPPKVEVMSLEKLSGKVEKYTYFRNWDLLQENTSKAFIYQTFANKQLSAIQYYQILLSLIILGGLSLTIYLRFEKNELK